MLDMWKVDEETSSFSAKDLQRESVKLSTTCKKKQKFQTIIDLQKTIIFAIKYQRPGKKNKTCNE